MSLVILEVVYRIKDTSNQITRLIYLIHNNFIDILLESSQNICERELYVVFLAFSLTLQTGVSVGKQDGQWNFCAKPELES